MFSANLGGGANAPAPIGEATFVIASAAVSNTTFIVPAGVFSLCALCVGLGGSATRGGALAWKNNIPVTPGQTLVIGRTGGSASVSFSSTTYCNAPGGSFSTGLVGDGGNYGGNGPGGGAGGYGGPGTVNGAVATGGAGSGGNPSNTGSLYYMPGGGGVGLLGQGASGAAVAAGQAGKAGSGGVDGKTYTVDFTVTGGDYGGGGGYTDDESDTNNPVFTPYPGGAGAIRLIWGDGRAFPSTLTGVL